jgi:hypothetical protein
MQSTQDAINSALEQYKPLEAQVASALPKVNDYPINGVWDDSGYAAAKKALRQAKAVANEIDKKRKELKAVALEYGRAVDGEAKRLTELCTPTITTLEQRIASVDMEKERLRNEKRQRRAAELVDAGYEFSAGAYRVGNEIIHTAAIDDATDGDWDGILARGRVEREKVEAEKQRQEQERIELERERQRLAEERAAMERERAELAALRAANDVAKAEPTPIPAPAPEPEPEPPVAPEPTAASTEPYVAGFDACRSLCIEIISRESSRGAMISLINQLQP